MKLANHITIRLFTQPEEPEQELKNKLYELIQIQKEQIIKQKIPYEEIKAKGFNEKKIKIITIILEKDRHINTFLETLKKQLSEEDKDQLLTQKNRLDKDLNYYLRLDKKEMLKGNYKLTDTGNCYHIKINIAAFPKKTEKAQETIQKIFK
ncbi:hypothetical protein K9L97_02460 [Candidatus Woesearchaeota archaeon]|nr:hypothetical protein [Candidatus Woesearchaeota archaeon]